MIPIEVKGERSGSEERRSDRRKLLNARGQTYAEFALIVPCFLLLLFGIMWLGLAVYTYNYVSYSAREGSRYAAVHGTDSKQPVTTSAAVTTFVENDAPGLNPRLTVSTTWDSRRHSRQSRRHGPGPGPISASIYNSLYVPRYAAAD